MIFNIILTACSLFVIGVLSLIPWDIPKLPQNVTDSADTYINLVGSAASFVGWIFTPALLVFIFSMTLVMLNFNLVVSSIFWAARKLPFLKLDK